MDKFFSSLREFARENPRKTLFSFCQEDSVDRVTYGQFLADIYRYARERDAARRGELVFIASKTDYASILRYFATLHNEAYPAYLSPLTPRLDAQIYARELELLVQRFKPNRVFAEFFNGSRLHGARTLLREEPGFLQFSSGTTGLRKGVFISERQLIAQLDVLGKAIRPNDRDSVACWLPLYHDMGLITSLFLPIYFGCSVAFLDPIEWSYRPDSLLTVITREKSTLCWQPDFAFRHIANRQSKSSLGTVPNLESLRMLINCSEPCRAKSFDIFWNAFNVYRLAEECLQTCYALAENVFAVTQSSFLGRKDWNSKGGFLSSGAPLYDCSIRVVNAGADRIGDIEIRSSHLFSGYLKHANSAEKKLVDGWFKTGDVGYWDDNQIFVVGRSDDTLIISGGKILAHQLEDHFGALPGIRPGRVLCFANSESSAINVIYEGKDLSADVLQRVRKWCATSAGVSISIVKKVEDGTLVKSSSGKISRVKSLEKLARMMLI